MSKMWGMPPKHNGVPGRMSCVTHTPARISAVSWASVPAIVAGALMPVCAMGPMGTGNGTLQVSKRTSIPLRENRSGLIGSSSGWAGGNCWVCPPVTTSSNSTTYAALGRS